MLELRSLWLLSTTIKATDPNSIVKSLVRVAFSQKNDSFDLNIQFPAKFFARSENLNLPHILPFVTSVGKFKFSTLAKNLAGNWRMRIKVKFFREKATFTYGEK